MFIQRISNKQKELTMHFLPIDETIRTHTILDLKHFNSQCLATQAEKGK